MRTVTRNTILGSPWLTASGDWTGSGANSRRSRLGM